MQAQVDGFMEANVHFIPSFYSIAAMDGQTAEHLQNIISKYSTPDISTIMLVSHQSFLLHLTCAVLSFLI
jgi:polyadenylate-binding protein